MNKRLISLFAVLILVCSSCSEKKESAVIYSSDQLKIHSIDEGVYVHEAYLQTESWGKVGCNGLIYVNQNEAVIFDTPPDTVATKELIAYVTDQLNAKVIAFVPTHFHDDCLGGLSVVHPLGIVSIANQLTVELASENEETAPLMGFDTEFSLPVGDQEVLMKYVGEGHTRDNIIGYVPSKQVMFGGCLIKKMNASKGYTGDANLEEWSNTIEKIKSEFPEAKIIVPGHGSWGGRELLDYTSELFEKATAADQ
ncbi:MAG: subclass B1 metallo-beta-lactamase [Reichenbachiella sp.]|uniref:subclass B1 metallo-beta-lactamase n=1 Tax=Reichenbachiella sp. TaxID=2184521 RepID=UPI003266EB63